MKEIILTKGKATIMDDKDFEMVSKYKWHTHKIQDIFYARTNTRTSTGQIKLYMHSLIAGKIIGLEIDHINHNGLDNRRENLRHVTRQQNQFNRGPNKNHSSIYKGVRWHPNSKKWEARIGVNGKRIHIGSFITESLAAVAYNDGAIKNFGAYAYLNKIRETK